MESLNTYRALWAGLERADTRTWPDQERVHAEIFLQEFQSTAGVIDDADREAFVMLKDQAMRVTHEMFTTPPRMINLETGEEQGGTQWEAQKVFRVILWCFGAQSDSRPVV